MLVPFLCHKGLALCSLLPQRSTDLSRLLGCHATFRIPGRTRLAQIIAPPGRGPKEAGRTCEDVRIYLLCKCWERSGCKLRGSKGGFGSCSAQASRFLKSQQSVIMLARSLVLGSCWAFNFGPCASPWFSLAVEVAAATPSAVPAEPAAVVPCLIIPKENRFFLRVLGAFMKLDPQVTPVAMEAARDSLVYVSRREPPTGDVCLRLQTGSTCSGCGFSPKLRPADTWLVCRILGRCWACR